MKNFSIAKSRRLRSTPYTSRIEKQGVTAYTIYNHMLLPAAFGSIEDSYKHLKEHVQVWDVAAERQVEISGKDSAELVQLMTCRDLSKSKIGRCYYCPIIDENGNLVNDPVVLKLDENKWWISIADSDVIFFAKGLASGHKFDVKIVEPVVDIMAIQGPKSFALMEKVFGKKITELKFFGFDYFDFEGTKHLIARSGWSKQGGYEVYVENTQSGQKLYDHLFEVGKEFNVGPGCPNLIERIESALLSYGNDFDNNDNPFECGFDQYVSLDSDINFLGKEKLKEINVVYDKVICKAYDIPSEVYNYIYIDGYSYNKNSLQNTIANGIFPNYFVDKILDLRTSHEYDFDRYAQACNDYLELKEIAPEHYNDETFNNAMERLEKYKEEYDEILIASRKRIDDIRKYITNAWNQDINLKKMILGIAFNSTKAKWINRARKKIMNDFKDFKKFCEVYIEFVRKHFNEAIIIKVEQEISEAIN